MAIADAVESNPRAGEESIKEALARLGAPPDEIAHVMGQYPVRRASAGSGPVHPDELHGAAAYRGIAWLVRGAMGWADGEVEERSDEFNRLVAEGLRCAWMTACAAGTLESFGQAQREQRKRESDGGAAEEASEMRLQSDAARRWCARYFATRLVELRGVPLIVAVDLAWACAQDGQGRTATGEQLFPARVLEN